MEIKSQNSNTIISKKGSDGKTYYEVNMGVIFYNDTLYRLNIMRIPLHGKKFFEDTDPDYRYCVVNIYYKLSPGIFLFETVGFYKKFVQGVSAPVVKNQIPVAQVVLERVGNNYQVDHFNEYSRMATFAISDSLIQGPTGLRGPTGETGLVGYQGRRGFTGSPGIQGPTGQDGFTGLGDPGVTGAQGTTGYMQDPALWLYLKFKADSPIQTDYSAYERDCTWYSPTGASLFNTEAGVVDNCHSVGHYGGLSSYKRNMYLALTGMPHDAGFTGGSLSCWVNLNVLPVPNFEYSLRPTLGLYAYKFTDKSLWQPTSWLWDFGDGTTSIEKFPFHQFPAPGQYQVVLTATNNYGSASKEEEITVG